MQISDSVIVITGGAQGLGRSMAENFAAQGASLALLDMNAEQLQDAQNACEKAGAKVVRTYTVNVTEAAAVEQPFAAIDADLDGIDVFINNAGILRDGMLIHCKEGDNTHKLPLQQWPSASDVNLTGAVLCGREEAAVMAQGKR